MALEFPRSDTPGSRPNAPSGVIGVNRPDAVLVARGAGRLLDIDLDRWERRAIRRDGPVGAPLVNRGGSVEWDSTKSTIDTPPDHPPISWGVPGFHPIAVGGLLTLSGGRVIAEPFWVAADHLHFTALVLKVDSISGPGRMRAGLVGPSGEVYCDVVLDDPSAGVIEAPVSGMLGVGLHYALLWSDVEVTLFEAVGLTTNQGITFDDEGAAAFTRRQWAEADLTDGLTMDALTLTDENAPTPGTAHTLFLRWQIA